MKLLFKQQMCSWLDSYDIYNEQGEVVFTVKGQLDWGHCLKIYDSSGQYAGMVREKVLTFLPRFDLYTGEDFMGSVQKEFTFFRPKYNIDFMGWQIEGNAMEWNYEIQDRNGMTVALIGKEIFHWTDTYVMDIGQPEDALYVVMLVLAIDAEKCSRQS